MAGADPSQLTRGALRVALFQRTWGLVDSCFVPQRPPSPLSGLLTDWCNSMCCVFTRLTRETAHQMFFLALTGGQWWWIYYSLQPFHFVSHWQQVNNHDTLIQHLGRRSYDAATFYTTVRLFSKKINSISPVNPIDPGCCCFHCA